MGIEIRLADLVADRQVVLDLVRDNLTDEATVERYEWLYRRNPDGDGKAWIASDGANGEPVGIASAYPRLMQVGGEQVTCWNLGEFAVSASYRSLGPALSLQRACLGPVLEGRVAFSYDNPNECFLALYRRLGIPVTAHVARYLKPLRVDRRLAGWIRSGLISRPLSILGNGLLRLRDVPLRARRSYEIRPHEGPFDSRFTQLHERVSRRVAVCGGRRAEYLNWRYRENPLHRSQVLTAWHKGEMAGYVVFNHHRVDGYITDLSGEELPGLARELLAATVGPLRRAGAFTVSAWTLEASPLAAILRGAGFFQVKGYPLVVCTKPGGPLDGLVTQAGNWFVSRGDRDT
ncbi:MAG TPA: GNAT family N-acetyltransferase [Candidatus Polarisedimenticolia bacterium]|nr:GNAT family N-acetyltransferase [Candidatus Polarisedimenticolia bacterium]